VALGIVAKSVLVVALLALVLLAQCEPQPVRIKQTYQIFLPIVAVSTDARFGTQSGWGNNSCDNTIYRLGMFCGNQHSLIDNALFLTVNHKGWYDYGGLAPIHPCTWDKQAQRLVDAKACSIWIFNHPGRYWIIGN
jgi:hypothetical protein